MDKLGYTSYDEFILNRKGDYTIKKKGAKEFSSVDYGVKDGDYTCWISGYINKDGQIVIDREGYKKIKEVKKVSRPYFETEVVKVKKEGKYIKKQVIEGRLYGYYNNKKGILCIEEIKPYLKPKKLKQGNWVNGENLDKIKFPCLCSYNDMTGEHIGMLITDIDRDNKNIIHLINIEEQSRNLSCQFSEFKLKDMMELHHVHILKGKIIIFEEGK